MMRHNCSSSCPTRRVVHDRRRAKKGAVSSRRRATMMGGKRNVSDRRRDKKGAVSSRRRATMMDGKRTVSDRRRDKRGAVSSRRRATMMGGKRNVSDRRRAARVDRRMTSSFGRMMAYGLGRWRTNRMDYGLGRKRRTRRVEGESRYRRFDLNFRIPNRFRATLNAAKKLRCCWRMGASKYCCCSRWWGLRGAAGGRVQRSTYRTASNCTVR